MTSVSFTKKEFDAIESVFISKYMDFNLESEEAEAKTNGYGMHEINEYKAIQNIMKKMLKSINKSGTWYLYQLIDSEKPATRDNIQEKYRL
jgi:phosphoribosylformylglycinamidine (FGAM) synthase PurS component